MSIIKNVPDAAVVASSNRTTVGPKHVTEKGYLSSSHPSFAKLLEHPVAPPFEVFSVLACVVSHPARTVQIFRHKLFHWVDAMI
jgi:hypothetical protein